MTSEEGEPSISWTVHPAADRPARAALGAAIVAAVAVLAAVAGGAWWWGIVAVAVLGTATARFYLPTRFTLDDSGVAAENPMHRSRFRWDELHRARIGTAGAFLARRAVAPRFGPDPGIHLLFGADRDAAVARIRQHLRPDATAGEPA